MGKGYIRRCLLCGNKTHKKYWNNEICPVCGIGSPYKESLHGGLSPDEIIVARAELHTAVRNVEGDPPTLGKER